MTTVNEIILGDVIAEIRQAVRFLESSSRSARAVAPKMLATTADRLETLKADMEQARRPRGDAQYEAWLKMYGDDQ